MPELAKQDIYQESAQALIDQKNIKLFIGYVMIVQKNIKRAKCQTIERKNYSTMREHTGK
jgi:hypothetical protein